MSKGPVFRSQDGKFYYAEMVACRGACLGFGSVPELQDNIEPTFDREPCPDCAGTGLEPRELEGAEAVEAAFVAGLLVRRYPEGMREVGPCAYVEAHPDDTVCSRRIDVTTRYTNEAGKTIAAVVYENNYETLHFFLPEDGQ